MSIKNEPKIKNPLIVAIREQLEHRALWMYLLCDEAKKKGLAMILISDELPEVIGMSDRLIIMKNGKIAGEFTRSKELDQETLIEVMV